MDYEKIYQDFYSKYYDKAEFLIKQFLIKKQSQNKIFFTVLNEVSHYFNDYSINKCLVSKNENLKKLHLIFDNRYRIYATNQIQGIFSDEIKTGFNKLKISELPKDYNYILFIKEIALLEVLNEISRLLSNNARLLEMMYKLNEFEDFEIRTHENLALEDYPIYKNLFLKLHPNYDISFVDDYSNNTVKSNVNEVITQQPIITKESPIVEKIIVKDYSKEIWFIVGCLIATGEMEVLLKKYDSATQVAKSLGIEKSRPYISDSKFNLKTNGDQSVQRNTNIYNDPEKIIKIYNYCTENKKSMTDEFIEIYSKIELI